MKGKSCLIITLSMAWGIASLFSQEALNPATGLSDPLRAEKEKELPPSERPVQMYAGVDLVSEYVSRGILFSDRASVQPWIEAHYTRGLEAEPGGIRKVGWLFGNWNSFQGKETIGRTRGGNIDLLSEYYETDLYTGPTVAFGEHLSSSFRYNAYLSPGGAFDPIHELDWRLHYDDSWIWQQQLGTPGLAVNPALRVAKEIHDPNGPNGWYFQPSLTLTYALPEPIRNLTIEVPLGLGLGADGQYRDAEGDNIFLGAFWTGMGLNTPLEVLPPDAGSLRLGAGIDLIFLTEDDINFQGKNLEVVGKLGLSWGL